MEKRYVLTSGQLNRALVAGAVQLGVIHKLDAEASFQNLDKIRSEVTENGVILTIDTGAVVQVATAKGKPGRKPGAKATAKASSTQTVGGIDSTVVKETLAKAGFNVGLNSINRWDSAQRQAAIDWCKNPSEATRPEFVKNRAPNVRKETTPPAVVVSGDIPDVFLPDSGENTATA